MNLSIGDIFPVIASFVALVAWSVRLEMKVYRNSEKIRDTDAALEAGDNRMNTIDGRLLDMLKVMNSKLDTVTESVNTKFNETSKSVSKIEGMLMHKDKSKEQS